MLLKDGHKLVSSNGFTSALQPVIQSAVEDFHQNWKVIRCPNAEKEGLQEIRPYCRGCQKIEEAHGTAGAEDTLCV